MKNISMGRIEGIISGLLLHGDRDASVKSVTIDSRRITGDEVFFALAGESRDGHDFIPDAISRGARNFIVSRADAVFPVGANVIKVADTTKALQDLAKWYISGLAIKTIGITGSTGKTTTKDLLYQICEKKYKTGWTPGNYNNHIGLPLSILSFDEDIEVGVLEMGTERLGEIHLLADIVKPDIGIITNIGVSHIVTFGTRENILRGKMEITDFFDKNNLLIVNEECDLLSKENVAGAYRLETVGVSGKSGYILSSVTESPSGGVEFTLERAEKSHRFKLGIPGRHNAVNAALAVAAAMEIGISMKEAAKSLEKVVLTEKRLNIRGKNGIKVIDDTYNASPDSTRAAIEVLLSTRGMRKVAILGDMLGLGEGGELYHRQIGEYIAGKNIDLLILIGELSKHIVAKAKEAMGGDKVIYYKSREKLEAEVKKLVAPGDVVLVKGSRAMAMEHIVRKILE